MTQQEQEAKLRALRAQNEEVIRRLREKLLALRVKHNIKGKKDVSLRT